MPRFVRMALSSGWTVLWILFAWAGPVAAVTIDWVAVGNPNNAPDTLTNCYAADCGSVDHEYSISKYEVTNAQYAEFLNAKAASDPLGLYSTNMALPFGGITRSGSSGSYTYSVSVGLGSRPVNFVSFYDVLRFANWLNNGQGSGDTETGAYTLLGGTATPSNGLTVTRNVGANIVIPSENEWYKAAYYNPVSGSFFDYPTGSDVQTICAWPTPALNRANCNNVAGNVADVGAYAGSASPSGTFDQGGNLYEWNEEIVSGSYRGLRGGDFFNPSNHLAASFRSFDFPASGFIDKGFRVARLVPLPPAIDWVAVGNPNNAPDTLTNCYEASCGSVEYSYSISRYEVTNAQYAEFLNAKAASDPLGLYNTGMAGSYGGITRSGVSGSYTYSVIAGRGSKPVNFVSFYDSLRFANWLNNGQGSGDTETGAYTLLGGTATPSNGSAVTRNVGANIVLPSENEWYKAAYYNPASANFFDYPAGSDVQTICATPTATSNSANCDNFDGDVTDVGSYTGSASPSGTFDQGGNVWEWNEQLVSGSDRGLRGGSFNYGDPGYLAASFRGYSGPADEYGAMGFRVARLAPPAPPVPIGDVFGPVVAGLLLMTGLLGLAGWRRRDV